jgi:3-phenylpropionate/trans-cinnamate dioxygenase ferredoxin subunit
MAPVRVASTADIPPGGMAAFDIDGTEVLVANCEGIFYAINNICSHAYAELSDGELDTDDCSVTCPVHGSAFDLRSGRPNVLPAFEPVAAYRLSVQGDDIFIDITDEL